jgi:hypothetical protein
MKLLLELIKALRIPSLNECKENGYIESLKATTPAFVKRASEKL